MDWSTQVVYDLPSAKVILLEHCVITPLLPIVLTVLLIKDRVLFRVEYLISFAPLQQCLRVVLLCLPLNLPLFLYLPFWSQALHPLGLILCLGSSQFLPEAEVIVREILMLVASHQYLKLTGSL